MLNLPFLKKKPPQKPEFGQDLLAIDIGTEYLKALLFKTNKLGIIVQKVSRIQQQKSAMSKGIIMNLTTVLENCKLTIEELTSDIPPESRPRKAVLGLAGEFIQGISIIVNYERDEKHETEVTEAEQSKIIAKVHNQIIQSGKEDLARRTGLLTEDIEIIHITVTGMEIGGMPVDSMIGFKGKSVRLFFYASFAPKTFIESLHSLTKSLELELSTIVSQPFAVARAFSGARNRDFSGIFIDIGGGTTDIAIVSNGNVVDTQMFAFGGRVFTKEIADKMNLDYRHAEIRKLKYSNGQLSGKISSETKSLMYEVSSLWMQTLQSALEMAEDIEVLPPHIYLCGGGALLPDIKDVMIEFPWTKLLPFSVIPKIELIRPDKLENVVDNSGMLINTYDVTPAALAKFAYDKIKNPENYYKENKSN
ncbi:hypothetical protein GF357_02160 [Candidatus Dojkabacteria bacterium]|nr:hypothetical protein [Candidatus Dojkabacteria bacterium]